MMELDSDNDEDLRLTLYLSKIESRSSPRKTTPVSEDDDYLFALKLSEEINAPSSSVSTFPTSVPDLESDFSFAKRLAQDEDGIDSDGNIDNDYLLAMKLAGEDHDEASHDAKKVEIADTFPNDITDDDYELALGLAEAESSKSSKIFNSGSDRANEGSSGPAFDSGISDRDLLLTAQLFDMDDSDVEIIDTAPTAGKDKTKRNRNNKKNSPCKTNPDKYMSQELSVVDPSWETIDPNPNIHALFIAFNKRFFWGKLDMVEVKWSPRMTLCAGICSYSRRAGYCVVKLSKPLLTYRPRKDLVETLLHEMIHAYLFVTRNDRDRDGHGPNFHRHMYRINKETGAHITVYHNFHDEVKMYKTHVWKCDGPCVSRKPFYGLVKRSMNRAPGPNDIWWADHSATCGGKFHKIKEPENYGKKKTKKTTKEAKAPDITPFLSPSKLLPDNASGTAAFSTSGFSRSLFESNPSSSASTSKSDSAVTTKTDSSSNSSWKPNNGDLFKRNPPSASSSSKIVTLSDLSKEIRKRRSATSSPMKSPKKWAPLPGQKNIVSFMNRS